jgi:hypothetical protein
VVGFGCIQIDKSGRVTIQNLIGSAYENSDSFDGGCDRAFGGAGCDGPGTTSGINGPM